MAASEELARRVVEAGRSCSLTTAVLEEWSRLGTPKQVEYLAGYLEAERSSREASKRATLLRRCALPAPKTFDGYDWSAVSWPEDMGRESLLALDFVERREDLVLMGDVTPPRPGARATRPRGRSPRPWRPCGCWRRWRTSPPSRPRTPGQPAGSARQCRRGRSCRSAAWDAHGDRARTGLQPPLAVAVAAVRPSSAQLVDHRVNDLIDEDFGERAHELMEVHHPVVETGRTLGAGASIWFTLCIAVISLHRIRLSQLQILRRWPLLCFRPLHRHFRHDRHFRMPLDEINGTAV